MGAFDMDGIVRLDVLGDVTFRIVHIAEDAALAGTVDGAHRGLTVLDAAVAEGTLLDDVAEVSLLLLAGQRIVTKGEGLVRHRDMR